MSENLDLKEISVVHKTGSLRMKLYENGIYFPYHWHDEYEFIRITAGSGDCVVNGESYTLNKGEALLVRSGELHTLASNSNEPFSFYAIVFHPDVVCGSDCSGFFAPSIVFQRIYREPEILESLDYIGSIFRERPFGFELMLKGAIINIFSLLFQKRMFFIQENNFQEELNHFTATLLEYIHANYRSKITLHDLSSQTNYGFSNIICLFKKYTGKTPVAYINEYRVYRAAELLKNTDKSITIVAMDCGFDNISYFIRTFKKIIGTTPLKYRKSY